MTAKPRGRQFFFNPGPTNIPDRVLNAMNRPTLDFMAEEFLAVQRRVHAALMRVLKTEQNLLVYASNGHGAWEAALVNTLEPGDRILMIESGRFSESWTEMAQALGYEVETLAAEWRRGVDPNRLAERLKQDGKGVIKAVLTVHNETSTGMASPIAQLRAAMDAVKHPALLMVDTISSLASLDFRMDEWGVDLAVGGSQKGLMMTTGLGFTGISHKAMERSRTTKTLRGYFRWSDMLSMKPQRFPGTTPVHMFLGLDESLKMLEEEGLEQVFARHKRLATATRAAIRHWGGNSTCEATIGSKGFSGPVKAVTLLPAAADRASDSVSAIILPDGHNADQLRKLAIERFNLSLGGGLACLGGRVFRIGHMGDLNEPMLLGALSTVELAMKVAGVPHTAGGVDAAIAALA